MPVSPDPRHAVLFSATLFAGLVLAGCGPRTSTDEPVATPTKDDPPLPLTVKFITINHIARLNDKQGEPKGIIGKQSFDVRLGDQITVEAEFSRAAYCYLVMLRPDGVAEPIFPEDAKQPPPSTDRPMYPAKPGTVVYELTDGTGLWIVGVCASASPLPPFASAIANNAAPKLSPVRPSTTVWWDDGRWLESLTKAGPERGARGATVAGDERRSITQSTDWLKSLVGPEGTAAAIAFTVR